MIRYLKLYKSFVKNCLIRELEFRLNFIIRTIVFFCWTGLEYASIFLIYSHVNTIGNWEKSEMLLLLTVFGFSNAFLKATLFYNIDKIPNYIKDGEMDFLLTKPINTRFLVSTRYFNLEQIPRLLMHTFLIFKISLIINPQLPTFQILSSFILIFIGIIGMYSLLFAISCIAFWKPRIWNLFFITHAIEDLAEHPSDIFKGLLGLFVTYLPIAAFATIPTKFLLKEGSVKLFFMAIVISGAFLFFSRLIWKFGLKQYESASS